jgi:erythromycin esterase
MRTSALACLLLLAAACHDGGALRGDDAGETPDLAQSPPDLATPLPSGVSKITGSDPSIADDSDLSALDDVIGDATAVGLGESIHTSGGFHDLKARIVRHLVEKKGFRLIAWEWQRVSGDVVEQYLTDCPSDAVHAAQQLSVWSSTSVQHMLEWVCTFNQAHPSDRVHFTGFDTQQPATDLDKLTSYLQGAAPGDAAGLVANLAECDRATDPDGKFAGQYAPCVAALDGIAQYFEAHTAALEAASSHEKLELARIAQIGAKAWQVEIYNYTADYKASYQARDDAMAEVLARLTALRYPGLKTIVWAHNYHLRKAGAKVTGEGAVGAPTMGMRIAERLGAAYAPIGITGYDVSIDWPQVGCGELPAPDGNDSMESALDALSAGDLLVDLAAGPTPPFAAGQEYGEGWYERMVPAEQYRALLFLDKSPAMQPLDWPACTPMN